MNVNPFLQKQGIDSVQQYPSFSERVAKNLREIWNKPQPMFDFDMADAYPIIYGSDIIPDLFITIKDKQIIKIQPMGTREQVIVLKQQKEFFKSISIKLAKNKELRAWFDALLAKWELPRKGPWTFFQELSGGRNELYLPFVIRNEELINDINKLCDRLKLRKEISEEFWTVSAYLLFRNIIDYDNLYYVFIESEGLFRIQTEHGFQLFLKLNRTINWNIWVELSKTIKD